MTIHETDIDDFIYNVSGAAQAIIDFDCNIGYHLDRIQYQFPPAVRFLTQAYQLDRSAHWEILNATDARLKKIKKKAEFHYKLDCLLEEIVSTSDSSYFLFPRDAMINADIASICQITQAVRLSDLNSHEAFFLNLDIRKRTTSADAPFFDAFINYIKEKHNV